MNQKNDYERRVDDDDDEKMVITMLLTVLKFIIKKIIKRSKSFYKISFIFVCQFTLNCINLYGMLFLII